MKRFNTHHAFLICGNRAEAEALYHSMLKDKEIEVSFMFEKNLSIDTAREIKEITMQTTLKSVRYIIVAAYSVGHEAQNALLKTLEELSQSKKLIFFVESWDALLSTFISRFSKTEIKETYLSPTEITDDQEVRILLKNVEKICKDIKDEVSTKSTATIFIDKLIVAKRNDLDKVKKLLYFKSCIHKPSAPVKHILESAIAIAAL